MMGSGRKQHDGRRQNAPGKHQSIQIQQKKNTRIKAIGRGASICLGRLPSRTTVAGFGSIDGSPAETMFRDISRINPIAFEMQQEVVNEHLFVPEEKFPSSGQSQWVKKGGY